MKTLLAPTEDFIKIERTKLGADATAGSSVQLTLDNTDGFSANDYIVIGHEGSELAECQQISSVDSDTTLTVATLKFNHNKDEPATKYRYNQRKFYGSTTKDGSYSELTSDGSPKDIQVDDPQGSRLEYTGSEGFVYFKSTYYNSQEDLETSIDDATATEADESKRYVSLYDIRKHAGLAGNQLYPDLRIEIKRKQAENEVNSYLLQNYKLPLSEIPPLIEQVTTSLAAGYIDFEEFGKDGEGVKWLGEARAILKQIRDGKQLLIKSDGTEMERQSDAGRLAGFPDNADADGAGERIFDIDQTF